MQVDIILKPTFLFSHVRSVASSFRRRTLIWILELFFTGMMKGRATPIPDSAAVGPAAAAPTATTVMATSLEWYSGAARRGSHHPLLQPQSFCLF